MNNEIQGAKKSSSSMPGGNGSTASRPNAGSAIDVELLAEKVYQLMLADLRQTRARGGLHVRR